jgi:maleylpyruvate isomerase
MPRGDRAGPAAMMTLHGYWRSTASYRVRIALGLKGIEHRQATHDLRVGAHRLESFTGIAPQGLVPALETDDATLTQSLAIIEWLDERWPEPALLPKEPLERAIVRSMAQIIASDIHPLNNLRVLTALRQQLGADEAQVAQWIARWITDGFTALETHVARYGSEYAYGDAPGLADCCLVPQLYAAERFQVDVSAFPRLVAAAERARQLPAFRDADPAAQPDAD